MTLLPVQKSKFSFSFNFCNRRFYLDEKEVEGKTIKFHYEIPTDPYEAIIAFAYNRTFLKSVFGVGYLPSKVPKQMLNYFSTQ